MVCNYLKRLDSGLRRNDGKRYLGTFYDTINLDELVKSPKTVMSDLIRHPELIEFTGFRLGRHSGPRSGTE
jgi:hypothetical protein